jgi:hypothetical protein
MQYAHLSCATGLIDLPPTCSHVMPPQALLPAILIQCSGKLRLQFWSGAVSGIKHLDTAHQRQTHRQVQALCSQTARLACCTAALQFSLTLRQKLCELFADSWTRPFHEVQCRLTSSPGGHCCGVTASLCLLPPPSCQSLTNRGM